MAKPALTLDVNQVLASSFEQQADALDRLIRIAQSSTGQSRRVANFLLAWWNAGSCGGFDFTDLWNVDDAIGADMVTVFGLVNRMTRQYPDALGYEAEFRALVEQWRPQLCEGAR